MGPENSWYLSLEQAESMFDKLLEIEKGTEVVALTGGEPTLHPKLFEIADIAVSKDIQYVLVNTNGNKIAADPDFAKRLADAGLHCYLQFDGFNDEVYKKLRGKELLNKKLAALEHLEKAGCHTVLSPVIARGVNEDQVGDIVRLALSHKFIKAVNFLPMTYVKQHIDGDKLDGKSWTEGETCIDPLDRLTIPEMQTLIAQQSNDLLTTEDFTPVPCHHPACGSVTYVIIDPDDNPVPISKIFDPGPFQDYIKNRARVEMDDLLQVTRVSLEKLTAKDGLAARGKVLNGIHTLVGRCCGQEADNTPDFEDSVKQISIHAFMDAHCWDVERARKCCIQYMLPDGRIMPFCQYNIFHRDGHRDRMIEGRIGTGLRVG